MTITAPYKVKEVAELTGLSIRTLHYYDEIGLLVPVRAASGYRLYTEEDLLRLQQVMIGRSLGLSLEEVRQSLDDPDFDQAETLKRQRLELSARLDETHRMITAIDKALAALNEKESPMDMKAIFDGFDPAAFVEEASTRWGDTDAYKQSARRTKSYTEEDWQAIKAEADGIWKDAATAMAQGVSPDSAEASTLAERHRQHIDRWFYAVTPEIHLGLADMWEADDRFRTNIDRHGEGLTAWFAAAIRHVHQES
ncbi:MAG: MerR family transcriptional regulator [Pseudomonadota bacterium]